MFAISGFIQSLQEYKLVVLFRMITSLDYLPLLKKLEMLNNQKAFFHKRNDLMCFYLIYLMVLCSDS